MAALLRDELGYRLQANAKVREGAGHPGRNAQFEHISRKVAAALAAGQPAVSVDTKKKELVGDFKHGGREWRPAGRPEEVRVHDFVDKDLGNAIPYGVYDLARNAGWVSVGVDHDTARFGGKSVEFCMAMVDQADVAMTPGAAFGEGGEGCVRMALVENEHRIRQALRQLGRALNKASPTAV